VLADVRKALRHEVERRHLETFRESTGQVDVQLHGKKCPGGQLLECNLEPMGTDDSRMDPTRNVSEFVE
jgi:hypothetical protein